MGIDDVIASLSCKDGMILKCSKSQWSKKLVVAQQVTFLVSPPANFTNAFMLVQNPSTAKHTIGNSRGLFATKPAALLRTPDKGRLGGASGKEAIVCEKKIQCADSIRWHLHRTSAW
jgi:hypothetical protein